MVDYFPTKHDIWNIPQILQEKLPRAIILHVIKVDLGFILKSKKV